MMGLWIAFGIACLLALILLVGVCCETADKNMCQANYTELANAHVKLKQKLAKLESQPVFDELEDARKELLYLQSFVADMNTNRNMALEMHTAIRKWRDKFWDNVVVETLGAIAGDDDRVLEIARETFDKETTRLIGEAKDITMWPELDEDVVHRRDIAKSPTGDEVLKRSLYKCGPSSSPEDSDSSEAT